MAILYLFSIQNDQFNRRNMTSKTQFLSFLILSWTFAIGELALKYLIDWKLWFYIIDIDVVHGIYGGTDAALGDYQYAVYLEVTNEGGVFTCNGVLFAANLVTLFKTVFKNSM